MPDSNAQDRKVGVTVEQMASRLVAVEVEEAHVKRPFAARAVSRRAGIAPSAIENLLRGRISAERISRPIERLYVGFLKRQIAKLETELTFVEARDPGRDVSTAHAALEMAKEALSERGG